MAALQPQPVIPPDALSRAGAPPRLAQATLPPGPGPVQSLRYSVRPFEFLRDCAWRYGDAFTMRLVGPPALVVSHPDAVRQVFAAEATSAGAPNAEFLAPIVGWRSVLVLDGAPHFRDRRLMGPPFHGERMHAYGRVMREVTDRDLERWPVGTPFAVQPQMQAITLEVIMRAVFGIEAGPRLARLRAHLLRLLRLADGIGALFVAVPFLRFELGGLTPWGRFLRERAAFRDILGAEFAERRTTPDARREDILSLLIAARDERGEPMTDDELFDEMFTLLMAGHETTAAALAWALYHVLSHADVLARVQDELRGTDDPSKLEYLDAVIKESARLSPTFPLAMPRRLDAPMRVAGWDVPAGVSVCPAIYLTHHRADLWPDPDRFDPERFLGRRPDPSTFYPFGGGVRRCLGASFATYEIKVVLARVLSRVALHLAPGYRMRPKLRGVAVAPSAGTPVVVEGRR